MARTFKAGEPVIAEAEPKDAVPPPERPYKTIAEADVEENDERVLGIAAHGGDGHLSVVTHGVYPAYVKGPVTRGNSLQFSKTDWCFVVGGKGTILADEDYEDEVVVRKMVRLGGGGGSTTCRLRLTDSTVSLEGVQEVDGEDTVEGDLIVVDTGVSTPNTFDGIWEARDVGSWVQKYTVDPALAPGVPVLSEGTVVTVWDGYSAPWLYVVGRNYYDPGP